MLSARQDDDEIVSSWFGLVWFLYLMVYQLFLGYLMPNPFSEKNRGGTI